MVAVNVILGHTPYKTGLVALQGTKRDDQQRGFSVECKGIHSQYKYTDISLQ
jgi:hypothetical protein